MLGQARFSAAGEGSEFTLARFLAVSLTDAMSRLFADFTRSLPAGRLPEDEQLGAVLRRHGVTMANGRVA